ncbi:MAG: Crp/Fnr family transcriptional regulator [Alkalinema sp. RU_4_3]|nr:Crp/Fnr family transcriptional regulator [Alkalinema sp. RU_4_3]
MLRLVSRPMDFDRSPAASITRQLARLNSISSDQPFLFNRRDQMPVHDELLWQILEGQVRTVTWDDEGNLTTLGIWGPSDCLGQPFSIVTPYQIECLSPVKAIRCPMPAAPQVISILLNNIQQTEKLMSILQVKSMGDRIYKILDWLSERFGRRHPTGKTVGFGLTHQQIADLAGTTRVTVTRLLQILEADAKIRRLPKRHIMLLK